MITFKDNVFTGSLLHPIRYWKHKRTCSSDYLKLNTMLTNAFKVWVQAGTSIRQENTKHWGGKHCLWTMACPSNTLYFLTDRPPWVQGVSSPQKPLLFSSIVNQFYMKKSEHFSSVCHILWTERSKKMTVPVRNGRFSHFCGQYRETP